MPTKPELSDEQVLEVVQFVEKERERGRSPTQVARFLGYKNSTQIHHVQSMRKRPGKLAYESMQRVLAARRGDRVAAKELPAPQPANIGATTPANIGTTNGACRRAGVLDDLDSARKSLDTAISDVKRASETSVPLLRPGLAQLAGKLEEARRWLVMS